MRRKSGTFCSAGFTVAELVIVSGIITMLTVVVFANFPSFNRALTIKREVNKMAFVLRKSQTLALAVREFNPAYADDPFCVTPPVRFPPYGVSFSMTVGGPGDQRSDTSYVLFGDADCSQQYTVSLLDGSNEQVEVFGMAKGIQIKSLTGFGGDCASSCPLSIANAVYQRPAPTVILSGVNLFNSAITYANLERLRVVVVVMGNQTLTETLNIRMTGLVSVQ